ncbi:MAG: four helix bundle protein [Deltaproteobacteria bacterium]|nr:four helix bundle protein [Deltaproteobacteria bacterium]
MDKSEQKSRSFRDLDVWKVAIELVKEIYRVTQGFPTTENFGLSNQIRRAAVSIPSNIAEGQGRNSAKEFKQFLGIALGSTGELETQLIIAKEINYLTGAELNPLLIALDRIRKMIRSLAGKLK